MDYSDVVIEMMSKRGLELNLRGIRYFTVSDIFSTFKVSHHLCLVQADARNMYSEAAQSFDAIVDKGTLDAIASSGIGDNSSDATRYIQEMWRVLSTGGLFVLITTMPPNVLQSIAIDPLLSCGDSGTRPVNWDAGHVCHQLQTPEGGDVYYYCLRKMADLSVGPFVPSSSSGGGNGADKEDIMSGILALLEEAKQAREAVDEAAKKVNKLCLCSPYTVLMIYL
jgi:SAM-dependent methyltransferase